MFQARRFVRKLKQKLRFLMWAIKESVSERKKINGQGRQEEQNEVD